MNDLVPFNYDGQRVRTVVRDSEPWFVVADICAVLDLSNPTMAAVRLDDDDLSTAEVIDSMGRTQTARIANEPGLFELTFQSRKPDAQAFRRWVTHELLPTLRKTGRYEVTAPSRRDLAQMVLEEADRADAAEAQVKELEPKAEYVDRYVSPDDVVTVKAWGAQYGLTDPQARGLLISHNIVYRHHIGKRWSERRQQLVDEWEYRARAGRQTFDWFDLRPQHNAPRHHNGQVRMTLYVRQQHAIELGKKVGLYRHPSAEGGAA